MFALTIIACNGSGRQCPAVAYGSRAPFVFEPQLRTLAKVQRFPHDAFNFASNAAHEAVKVEPFDIINEGLDSGFGTVNVVDLQVQLVVCSLASTANAMSFIIKISVFVLRNPGVIDIDSDDDEMPWKL